MRRRGLVTLALVVLVCLGLLRVPLRAADTSGPTTTSATDAPPKAYVVVDADTGAVLAADNHRAPLPPASISKVVTALVAGTLVRPGSKLTVSERAAAQPSNKVGASAGEEWDVDTAMHVMLLQSANDLAMSFAEQAAGSAEGFGDVMTKAARVLGMSDQPVLKDPAGLDDGDSVAGGNLISARDLAVAARALLADSWLGPIVGKPAYRFTDPKGVVHDGKNHNKLLHDKAYGGAMGVKTGFTRKAGRSLAAAAQRNGRTLIVVVLNVFDTYGWAAKLLDQGFATPSPRGAETLPPIRSLRPADVALPRPTVPPSVQSLDGNSPATGQGDVDPGDAEQTGAVASAPAGGAESGDGGTSLIVPAVAVIGVVFGGLLALSVRRRRRSAYAATWRA